MSFHYKSYQVRSPILPIEEISFSFHTSNEQISVLLYHVDEMRSVKLISTECCAFLGMLLILGAAGMYMFSITVLIYVQAMF